MEEETRTHLLLLNGPPFFIKVGLLLNHFFSLLMVAASAKAENTWI
jgi:hypothetical protein